jgi:ligand-binding sensor protein
MKTTLKLIRNGARNKEYLSTHMLSRSCNATPLCLSTSILTDIIRSDRICSERQGTLDSVVTKQPRTPPYTSAGLLDYIVELVVSEDDVCIIYSHFHGDDMDQNI